MKKFVPLYLLCTVFYALRGFQNLSSIYWFGIIEIAMAIVFAVLAQLILLKENRIETTNEEDEE